MTNVDRGLETNPNPGSAGHEPAARITARGRLAALADYRRKLRGRPIGFLVRRSRRATARRLRIAGSALGFSSYALPGRAAEAVTWSPSFRLPWEGIPAADLRAAAEPFAEEVARVRRRADDAVMHRFDLLGSGPRELGPKIDWSLDFRSGLGWARKHHARYTYAELLDGERSSDVKVPWELNRLQFLAVIAECALLTGEDRYAEAASDLLREWDLANPVGIGIPWTSPMEAGLRAISMIWAAELLRAGGWGERLRECHVPRLLAEHGRYLYRNVEFSDLNTNHHTACVLGLLYLGLAVGGVSEAGRWRATAVRSLRREILAQTSSDGVCREGSIPYHGLVTELFLHARIVAGANGLDLGTAFDDRLLQMLEFVRDYTKPSGLSPLLGDNDDGRVLPLGNTPHRDHRDLLAAGAAMFGRADLKKTAGDLRLDAFWLLGPAGVETYRQMRPASAPAPPSARGGFFFLRNEDDLVAVDCGDVGWNGRGGHGHEDTLSFEACLDGLDVISDTGSLTYSASRDTRLRSIGAGAHNVVVVDGAPPSELTSYGIASVGAIPFRALRWAVAPDAIEFVGEHGGYRRLDKPVTFRRSIRLSATEPRIVVGDALLGEGEHLLRWRFHLDPGWRVVGAPGRSVVVLEHDRGDLLSFRVCPDLPIRVETAPFYPAYGHCVDRLCLTLQTYVRVPYEARFEIGTVLPGQAARRDEDA